MGKKKYKASKRKKSNLFQVTNKISEKDKITQTKYHHLNMKVQDMLRTNGIDSENINFIGNPNEIKMSAVILKLAEPYIKMYLGNETRIRGIILIVITIWNMTFLPLEEQIEFQKKWLKELLPEDYDLQELTTMLYVFEDLRERKKNLFPSIRTVIMGHDLRIDSENMHLDISSAPLDKKN